MALLAVSLQILALSARGSLGYPTKHHYQDLRLGPQGLLLIIGIIVSIEVIEVITDMSSSVILCIVYSCHRLPSNLIENSEAGNSTKSQSSQSSKLKDEQKWKRSCSLQINCILLKSPDVFGSRLHGSHGTFDDSRSMGLYSPLVITSH